MANQTPPVIPIENLYYLLCYAWNALKEAELVEAGKTASPRLVDLLGRVLHNGTAYLLRHGLGRDYQTCGEIVYGIRGKLLFAPSLRRNSFQRARTHCEFDELTYDVLHNRILKTTIGRLVRLEGMDRQLRDRLRGVHSHFHAIQDVDIQASSFRKVRLHRNNRIYGLLLNVCELIYENLLPDEAGGGDVFREFDRDDRAMAKLFEKFIYHFYRTEQERFGVSAPIIAWHGAATAVPGGLAYLPQMHTDVVLSGGGRDIILDAKYYRQIYRNRYDKKSFHSGHLYQLYAYLRNYAAAKERDPARCEGMLLYPQADEPADYDFVIGGYRIRICTVDLARPWPEIHGRLLALLD